MTRKHFPDAFPSEQNNITQWIEKSGDKSKYNFVNVISTQTSVQNRLLLCVH